MDMNMEMPKVDTCAAVTCSYNRGSVCHARAITIGDMTSPDCDTRCILASHTRRKEVAGVGACKMIGCMYNTDLECQADFIEIALKGDEAQCGTYQAR